MSNNPNTPASGSGLRGERRATLRLSGDADGVVIAPGEADADLTELVGAMNALAAADRAAGEAAMLDRVAAATLPALRRQTLPIAGADEASGASLDSSVGVWRVRVAAALALCGAVLAVVIAGSVARTGSSGVTLASAAPSSAAVGEWAAVSSLFEDDFGADLDVLAAEANRLGSAVRDVSSGLDPSWGSETGSDGAGGAL